MTGRPVLAFFGSSLVSAYWNGAATYYRGIVRALAGRGVRVTFYEPDVFDRQAHRDIPDPEWARVVVYPARSEADVLATVERARTEADVIVKTSGVGAFDDLLESAIAAARGPAIAAIFWDVDAPATLDRLGRDPADPFRALVPQFDAILTYGGGEPVVSRYLSLGARRCVPVYNALDPATHHPCPPDPWFAGDLGFLGNRLPDREARADRFFFDAAVRLSGRRFVLGGNGWGDRVLPSNVRYLGHVYTADHNAFNSTMLAVLNISRESMARYGFSPATRLFEAAGAGACVITDAWEGIEGFLEPGRETLVARDGAEVADLLDGLTPERAADIGRRARARMLAEHTYEHRVRLLESLLDLRAPA